MKELFNTLICPLISPFLKGKSPNQRVKRDLLEILFNRRNNVFDDYNNNNNGDDYFDDSFNFGFPSDLNGIDDNTDDEFESFMMNPSIFDLLRPPPPVIQQPLQPIKEVHHHHHHHHHYQPIFVVIDDGSEESNQTESSLEGSTEIQDKEVTETGKPKEELSTEANKPKEEVGTEEVSEPSVDQVTELTPNQNQPNNPKHNNVVSYSPFVPATLEPIEVDEIVLKDKKRKKRKRSLFRRRQ